MKNYRTKTRFKAKPSYRRGMVVVLLAIMLPVLLGMVALILDGGTLMLESRQTQNVSDAAALAAATQIRLDQGTQSASIAAVNEVQLHNNMPLANVQLNHPPLSGPYSGSDTHVEVIVRNRTPLSFRHLLGGSSSEEATTRSVAGVEPATAGAAIVVLDPNPEPLSVASVLTLPAFPHLIGGLEILGLGHVRVDDAVLVNNTWGGVDQYGNNAGILSPFQYAVASTPLVELTRFKCRNLRVVGGVDNEHVYGPLKEGDPSPLTTNRLPTADPLIDLPVPTEAADPVNVNSTNRGGRTIVSLPIGPPVVLQPGVYEWIDIIAGKVVFEPGVYVIRGKSPLTQISLSLIAGRVKAEGVMFYLTDSSAYSATSGMPDALDGQSTPPSPGVGSVTPSVVINLGLAGSTFTPLKSPGSPYHNMMFFQRRHDRRPLVFVQESLLHEGTLEGRVYAKWGHTILAGKGEYNASFVTGTMRIVALLDMQIAPDDLLPPAVDVFLVE